MATTFGIPGTIVHDMEMNDGPLPPGVHAPRAPLKNLDATVVITCTDEQARAMERWLRDHASASDEPDLYRKCAELIRRTLELPT
jgi:hypothetical protein